MKRSLNVLSRCQYRSSAGRQCRFRISCADSQLCSRHDAIQRQSADLAAALTGGLTAFTSAAQINDFLSRLLLLLAHNRLSSRRAAVLAYITNQLLRTLSAMEKESEDDDPKNRPIKVIWDLPHPPHERPDTSP